MYGGWRPLEGPPDPQLKISLDSHTKIVKLVPTFKLLHKSEVTVAQGTLLLKDVLEAKYGGVRISLQLRIANFLLWYRNTPHSVTGRTPAELFLKRQMRTRFSLLKPGLSKDVEAQQMKQKLFHDRKGVDERVCVTPTCGRS